MPRPASNLDVRSRTSAEFREFQENSLLGKEQMALLLGITRKAYYLIETEKVSASPVTYQKFKALKAKYAKEKKVNA